MMARAAAAKGAEMATTVGTAKEAVVMEVLAVVKAAAEAMATVAAGKVLEVGMEMAVAEMAMAMQQTRHSNA